MGGIFKNFLTSSKPLTPPPPLFNMKIVPTGLHSLLLFNLLFFIDENLEIGFATKVLLEKLLNEVEIVHGIGAKLVLN